MNRIYSLLIALTVFAAGAAVAEWAEYPTGDMDSRTSQIQAKVESLYRRGDFKRAHFIYSKELAPLGDKYAQYMTGYMHLMGQGVEEDKIRASAWYRIAAERKTPEFLAVRDQLLRTMTSDELAASDELYLGLRKNYSDLVIVMGLIVEDLPYLETKRTGSRLAGYTSSVTVIDPNTGFPSSADHLQSRALRAMQARLDFVTDKLDINNIRVEEAGAQVDVLWERINDYLGVVDDELDAYVANPGK
ncbi:MAG: SEL1-like repeat protein [Gammaproteobacteria bacterium]|nr:SEL1-like repeat protein [Gammaproteobacteria bacterium]